MNPRMKRVWLGWVMMLMLCGMAATAAAQTDYGRLSAVDLVGRQLTLGKGRKDVTYRIRDTVEVYLNGVPAKLPQLPVGAEVLLEVHEPGVATAILAKSIGALGLGKGPVNLNTATVAELEALPGIGPALADAIVAERPYLYTWRLSSVRGIGEKTFKKLERMVYVTPLPGRRP